MALSGSAARRYAEALFQLSTDERDTRASLDRLAAALDRPTLRQLSDPSVALERRMAAVAAATEGQPEHVRSLAQVLAQRGRITLLPQVAAAFGGLVDRRAGLRIGKITTAIELGERERTELIGRLEQASGTRIKATFAVDPSLIGGARVQIGDHLIDGSVKAQLGSLRTQLAS